MGYRHGIYISELATSITPPVQVSAGLIVAFGTAPVNQLEDPASAVNKPIIAYTYAEAVSKIGYSTNFEKYTLSEVIKVAFGIYVLRQLYLSMCLIQQSIRKTLLMS